MPGRLEMIQEIEPGAVFDGPVRPPSGPSPFERG